MESLGVIRALWRHRALVGIVAALSLLAAFFSLYRVSPSLESRSATYSFTRQRVLVDTPRSLTADSRARAALSLATVAEYLGDEMASPQGRLLLAQGLGVNPSELAVVSDEGTLPRVYNPLAQKAVEVARPRKPYVVSIGAEPNLPILSIGAVAPDLNSVRDLAREAPPTLRAVAKSALPTAGAVRIKRLGKPESGTRRVGASKIRALAVALVLFVLGCIAIILFDRLRLRGRDSAWPEAWYA